MASSIIHLAVAKKVSEKISITNIKDYYIGSIAPDISRQIGESKEISHFQRNSRNNTPNIELFLMKYPDFKHNDFELGYFVHLYTDKLWEEEFINNISHEKCIKSDDGTYLEVTREEMKDMIYSDYTNINKELIDDYNIDLSIFYEEYVEPKSDMTEVPTDKLDILINKMGILIENSKEEKPYSFDIKSIEDFIDHTVEKIEERLKEVR